MKRTLKARLLYEQERYDELASIAPEVDTERLWQLTALAKTNLKDAGMQLHALVQQVSPGLPQLRVLAGYYAAIDDKPQQDRVMRLIVKLENKHIEKIKSLVQEAIDAGNKIRAMQLLKQLDTYHPEEDYNLRILRAKVSKLYQPKPDKAA